MERFWTYVLKFSRCTFFFILELSLSSIVVANLRRKWIGDVHVSVQMWDTLMKYMNKECVSGWGGFWRLQTFPSAEHSAPPATKGAFH